MALAYKTERFHHYLEAGTLRINHELLRRRRHELGLSQEAVAKKIGVDVRTYRRYERGQTHIPEEGPQRHDQSEICVAIAQVFGIPIAQLLVAEPAPLASPAPGGGHIPSLAGPSPGVSSYDPATYVHREKEESHALARLHGAGRPVVLQAPEHAGKATLRGFLVERLLSGPTPPRVAYLNLARLAEDALRSYGALLYAFAAEVLRAVLAPETAAQVLERTWQGDRHPQHLLNALLREHVPRDRPFLLVLERADRIYGHPYQDDFFGMLRGWVEAWDQEPFSRLRLLLTVATEPHLLESGDHSSFFALANPIQLRRFDGQQLDQLIARYYRTHALADREALEALLGGHPYLSHLAVFESASEGPLHATLADEEFVAWVFDLHLKRLRHFLERSELVPAVQAALADPVRRIDQGGHLPGYYQLYSKGVLEEADGAYRFPCPLLRRYLEALYRKR